MEDETKDILTRLDNIAAEETDLAASMASCKTRRSDLLAQLQKKVGKTFLRKGVTYTICQRGDTYFTKSSAGKVIPSLDD